MANWRKYIFEDDDEAAAQIMLAANYGGRAINITATTAAHAMSYKITSLYKLPHGHAVAVCLPEIWEYMIGHIDKCVEARGADYLKDIFNQIAKSMCCANPTKAIEKFRRMMQDMDLNNPVGRDRKVELENLSKSVNPVRLKNNPIALDVATMLDIYQIVVK